MALVSYAFRVRRPCLLLSIVFRHMVAARTGLTGVLRWHGNNKTAVPCRLVLKLSPKLSPALIEHRPIQAGFLFDHLAVLLVVTLGRLGHMPNLQIFDGDHGVVWADLVQSLVQNVFPGVGDARVNALDVGVLFRFLVWRRSDQHHSPVH